MKKKIILVKSGPSNVDRWIENLKVLLPDFFVDRWDSVFNIDEVEYVVAWMPNARWVNMFPNLKALVSLGSGVDHIKNLDELREDIPVIRTVSDDLIQRMKEFIVMVVLYHHREFKRTIENNISGVWERISTDTALSIKVGILGYGNMGKPCADALHYLGYDVSVWANTQRDSLDYSFFYGPDQLQDFLKEQDILICMLPLTKSTEGIFNKKVFDKLKKGVCIVNVGRGSHIVNDDLLESINTGIVSYAILDVFDSEPLDEKSELWLNEKILVTSHSAAFISPKVGPAIVARNIFTFENNGSVEHRYDRKLGY